MKKAKMLLLAAIMILAVTGCGGKQEGNGEGSGGGESKYAQSVEVLNEVVKVYGEDELFAMYGGNQENAVMDAPGSFDISKTQELEYTLGFPLDQLDKVEDAASMVHMMNANTFTGAVYHLKEGEDMDAFAEAVKSCILAKQWVCGQPETLVVINVDGRYVITAYGVAELIEVFKGHALSALEGAQVITEAPIV